MSAVPVAGVVSVLEPGRDAGAISASASASPAQAQHDFLNVIDGMRASNPAGVQPAALEQPLRPGRLGSGNTLGDQVLDGLQKLGRNLQDFNAMSDMPAHATPAAASAPLPNGQASAAGRGSDPASALHDMWETGMQEQKKLYSTVFEFELVEESSQSMMKSLKSLLTQGGG